MNIFVTNPTKYIHIAYMLMVTLLQGQTIIYYVHVYSLVCYRRSLHDDKLHSEDSICFVTEILDLSHAKYICF